MLLGRGLAYSAHAPLSGNETWKRWRRLSPTSTLYLHSPDSATSSVHCHGVDCL